MWEAGMKAMAVPEGMSLEEYTPLNKTTLSVITPSYVETFHANS